VGVPRRKSGCLLPEALVNVSDNYNRSKVARIFLKGSGEDWNDYENLVKIKRSPFCLYKMSLIGYFGEHPNKHRGNTEGSLTSA